MTDLHTHKMPEAFLQKLQRHAHADEEKALIEKAKAKGWRMASYGRGKRVHCLYTPTHERLLCVTIERRMPCPACQPISWEEARALAWEELLDWIGPEKLRHLIGDQS